MPQYENIGASPWRRESGVLVPPGGTFEATGREHDRIQRRLMYQRRVRLVDNVNSPSVASPPTVLNNWPLKMLPRIYLKLHPEGKHAARARELVAADVSEEVQTS
jgi:hypothetical protein